MKRLICFLALLCCFSLSAFAVPKVDGRFGMREYNETLSVLQIPQHEANNALSFAYLHWVASPADYSVYLALQYICSDRTIEEGRTGVMVFINDVLVGTVYADGAIEDVDHDRYELEGILDDGTSAPPFESFCEIRAGIKFWPEGDIYAGIQILDFSGNPSNYYRQLVYSPYTTTTKPDDTTTSNKTTTEKSTSVKPTTTDTVETVSSTARAARTTSPVITASPTREATASTATVSTVPATVLTPTSFPKEAAASSKAAKSETTKAKTTKAKTTKAKATKPTASETTTSEPAAAVLPATTEAESSAATTAASTAQMYSELNKVKIVGTVLVVVILTAAIMSSVFLGMRQKKDGPQHTPQEEYDDFG